jgi:hypothetical protein
MIVTDGGFRADGTFVSWPAHEATPLAEAFRRAVLRLFVRRGVFEDADALPTFDPFPGWERRGPRTPRSTHSSWRTPSIAR